MKYLILLLTPFLFFSKKDFPEEYCIDNVIFKKVIKSLNPFAFLRLEFPSKNLRQVI